jgi:LmbE family N-acetylglucosaminyl deacetylase
MSTVEKRIIKLRRLVSSSPRWRIVVSLFILLIVLIFLFGLLIPSGMPKLKEDLSPLSFDDHHRVLVLAPHCDDETLGSAGLILAAIRSGLEVRVVLATNGDGYLFATMEEFHHIYPSPQDFIRMGNLRQQESLTALKTLGVGADHVSFLSYPDRGTPSLWNDNWEADTPYRSPYSRETHSPYPITYDPKAVYAGEDLLGDLIAIMKDYRPDLVIYPHPEDVHPDHWGLYVFSRLATTSLRHQDPTFLPTEYTYLVHRSDFPTVKGFKPQESLLPPPSLYDLDPDWFRWDLNAGDIVLKGKAVYQYHSQLPLLHKLLLSFVRANELFATVVDTDLPMAGQGDPLDPTTWQDTMGQPVLPVQMDPVFDTLIPDAVPASDLMAIYAAQNSAGMLWTCAQVIDEASREIVYYLRLKALNENGIIHYGAWTGHAREGWHIAIRSSSYVCDQIDLAELGNPWAIFLGAVTEGPDNTSLDHTASKLLYVKSINEP